MKYFLAIDLGRSKSADKSDRYAKINLSEVTGLPEKETSSIIDIIKFTSRYTSETAMMYDLITKGFIDPNHLGKHFTICYKSPKKTKGINEWTRCCRKAKDQSAVLFSGEAQLLNNQSLKTELLSRQIPYQRDFDYNNCTPSEQLNLSILSMIVEEIITNDFYQYQNVRSEAFSIRDYLNKIKKYNYIELKYINSDLTSLADHMMYQYDKFDTEKTTPLIDKNGKRKIKYRTLFEFVMFYVYCCRELQRGLDKKHDEELTLENMIIDESTGEVLEAPIEKPAVRIRKPKEQIDGQLSIFDILKK